MESAEEFKQSIKSQLEAYRPKENYRVSKETTRLLNCWMDLQSFVTRCEDVVADVYSVEQVDNVCEPFINKSNELSNELEKIIFDSMLQSIGIVSNCN